MPTAPPRRRAANLHARRTRHAIGCRPDAPAAGGLQVSTVIVLDGISCRVMDGGFMCRRRWLTGRERLTRHMGDGYMESEECQAKALSTIIVEEDD